MSQNFNPRLGPPPIKVLCPCCLGKGTYPAKVNDRKRGCYMADRPCPCCDGAKLVSEADMHQWLAKCGRPDVPTSDKS